MKRILIFLATAVLFTSCNKEQPDSVRIEGTINDESTAIVLSSDGALSMLDKRKDIIISVDENGFFDTIIPLSKGGYYTLNQYIPLYLEPGHDFKVNIQAIDSVTYNGKGAKVNEYLLNQLRAWSFTFNTKCGMEEQFLTVKPIIDSVEQYSRDQLRKLGKATIEFRELESASIHAKRAYHYLFWFNNTDWIWELPEEEVDNRLRYFWEEIAVSHVKPLLGTLIQDKYLDVPSVRDVLKISIDDRFKGCGYFDGFIIPDEMVELLRTRKNIERLRNGVTPELVTQITDYMGTLKNEAYKEALSSEIEKASILFPGKPAFDIEMKDANGQCAKLSDFKGKLLYVDLWASWCGPCKKEEPFFAQLSQKYAKNDNIAFIQISFDRKKADWENAIAQKTAGIPQFIIADEAFTKQTTSGWTVKTIPRFLLIDKNFTIIAANAPAASDSTIDRVLSDALTNN